MTDIPSYVHCPKCLHTPLPADQSLPAACPKCGLILAKFAVKESGEHVTAPIDDLEPGRWQQLKEQVYESVRYIPTQVNPVTFWLRCGLLLWFLLWGLRLIWMDYQEMGVGASFLHGPLLIFHEAGHVIFRLFGEFFMVLGGTLGQLLMPAIMTVALLRNRDPFAASIGLWFFGVSVLDVAPYVYDALHPQLILLGGNTGEEGGHDWIFLLNETGLLPHAQGLGWFTHAMGALIVLLALTWGGWILHQQKSRLAH
jgi:hypothetical protein